MVKAVTGQLRPCVVRRWRYGLPGVGEAIWLARTDKAAEEAEIAAAEAQTPADEEVTGRETRTRAKHHHDAPLALMSAKLVAPRLLGTRHRHRQPDPHARPDERGHWHAPHRNIGQTTRAITRPRSS
jgi:hypothetical protein